MEIQTPSEPRLPAAGESDRIQRDLEAVQAVLDGLDRIPPTLSADDDPAVEILALVATGFDLEPTAAPPERADPITSDLIGDRHVVAVEQVDALPQPEALPVVADPPATEVRDPVMPPAEEMLDRHDHPTVGDHHHL